VYLDEMSALGTDESRTKSLGAGLSRFLKTAGKRFNSPWLWLPLVIAIWGLILIGAVGEILFGIIYWATGWTWALKASGYSTFGFTAGIVSLVVWIALTFFLGFLFVPIALSIELFKAVKRFFQDRKTRTDRTP